MTIAQQLKIKDFPFFIKDKNGREIYKETNTYWWKREYDANGRQIYYEDSKGFWVKREFDSNGNEMYSEDSTGFWFKNEYDSNGKQIYHENSSGIVVDNRPKPVMELTLDEIATKFNIPVNQLKIKK